MSKAKFSFEGAHAKPSVFDDAGGNLFVAERLAVFFQRPDLAEKMGEALKKSINHQNLYDILPITVIRELYQTLIQIESASASFIDSEFDLFPEVVSLVTPGNEDLFEVIPESGSERYNLNASLTGVTALREYFQQALQLNKEIDFGKYS